MRSLEGTYGRIEDTGEGTVKKVPHRKKSKGSLSLDEQKAIHALIIEETSFYTVLRAPHLIVSEFYEMERINTDKPIFLGCQGSVVTVPKELVSELAELWRALHKKGYLACDFELYLQTDGRVCIVDFDKFKKGQLEDIQDSFFIHPCFPRGFKDLVWRVQ
jgi:hypothetical protein